MASTVPSLCDLSFLIGFNPLLKRVMVFLSTPIINLNAFRHTVLNPRMSKEAYVHLEFLKPVLNLSIIHSVRSLNLLRVQSACRNFKAPLKSISCMQALGQLQVFAMSLTIKLWSSFLLVRHDA